MSSIAALSDQSGSTFSIAQVQKSSFSGHVALLLDRIDCRLADSGEQREAIFRLRYQAYIRDGAISPNSSGRFSDPYDETGNVYLFGLYIDEELASSIRLHVASREHPVSPSLEVFADVLQPKLDVGKIIIDTTHFVADENLARLHRGLPYATLRLCMLAAQYFKADHLLAAASAAHQVFYQRAFGYRLIGEPRPYPLLAKSLGLMTADYPAATDQLYQRYPFFRSPFFERRMLFERPMAGSLQPGVSGVAGEDPPFVKPPAASIAG